MLPVYALVALLHAYIGGRLLPEFPYGAVATPATATMLLASLVLVPIGLAGHRAERGAAAGRTRWAGLIALGLFSSLIVLTLGRDLALGIAFLAGPWLDTSSVDAFKKTVTPAP